KLTDKKNNVNRVFIHRVLTSYEIVFIYQFLNDTKFLIIPLIFLVIYKVKDQVRGGWKSDIFICLL
ncbi:hypothetical protein, partial [Salmonella enterica]|uniref:hypothetical protein n=1 Tax=Salmonella enterica TaxID=28901 RepID=UPI001F422AE5